ncbi:MAG: DUF3108 domain-containing protein [Pseudohongiellaceae bacterium]
MSEYTANYQASANGLSATATRSLTKLGDNSYRLRNSLEASLAGQSLARLDQSSEFELQGERVVPLNYSYLLSGVSRASHAIVYNWDAKLALSSEDEESWQLQLSEGVMDQLSYQTALRQLLLANRDALSSFAFQIIDGDGIDRHEYRVVGREIISTPLGALNTLKLERVRAASDDRVTEIWLAEDWGFLIARLEQLNSSGLRIVMELKSAEIGGEAVSAIN